jgi:hypothetical protein
MANKTIIDGANKKKADHLMLSLDKIVCTEDNLLGSVGVN